MMGISTQFQTRFIFHIFVITTIILITLTTLSLSALSPIPTRSHSQQEEYSNHNYYNLNQLPLHHQQQQSTQDYIHLDDLFPSLQPLQSNEDPTTTTNNNNDTIIPNLRITLETSSIAGTGAIVRFTLLTTPNFTSIQIGYQQPFVDPLIDGCQLFDYVPQNSFFSPNWDNVRIENCFYFNSWTKVGLIDINSDSCAWDNVFTFRFLSNDLTEIQENFNIGDMIECYLNIAVEPTFPDLPTTTDDDDDNNNNTPFILLSNNNRTNNNSKLTTTLPTLPTLKSTTTSILPLQQQYNNFPRLPKRPISSWYAQKEYYHQLDLTEFKSQQQQSTTATKMTKARTIQNELFHQIPKAARTIIPHKHKFTTSTLLSSSSSNSLQSLHPQSKHQLHIQQTDPSNTTIIIPPYTLQTPQNLSIYNQPGYNITFLYDLPVSPVTNQSYIYATAFKDYFAHFEQRISIFELWFLEIPPSSSIPIGLYRDELLQYNLLEDNNMVALQERLHGTIHFNYQCLRNITRLHTPLQSTYFIQPDIPANATQLEPDVILPTTRTYLNVNADTGTTFLCQFLFQAVPYTQNYTFTFGNVQKTMMIQPALDLKNKIVQISDVFDGIVNYTKPIINGNDDGDTNNGGDGNSTPYILNVDDNNHNNNSHSQNNNNNGNNHHSDHTSQTTFITTQTDPPIIIDNSTLYYNYTHRVTVQLPSTIFTNQTFMLELDSNSQTIFTNKNIIMNVKPITTDINIIIANKTNIYDISPYSISYREDEYELDSDAIFEPDELTPGQLTIQYLHDLPEDWNRFWSSWHIDIYDPSPTSYQYWVPPPTPLNAANISSTFEINTLIPINQVQNGFDLFYSFKTYILIRKSTSRYHVINYNPTNPIQLSFRPTIFTSYSITPLLTTSILPSLPTSKTILENTTNMKWVYEMIFNMNPDSIPTSPPSFTIASFEKDNDIDERQYGYNKRDNRYNADGLYITGFYTSPITTTSSIYPQCKLLLQTQSDIITNVTNPRQISTIDDDNNNEIVLYFNNDFTFTSGKYWRLGVELPQYRSTDVFMIRCEQELNGLGWIDKEKDYSVMVNIELQSHPRRWYIKTPKTRTIDMKIIYPIDDVLQQQQTQQSFQQLQTNENINSNNNNNHIQMRPTNTIISSIATRQYTPIAFQISGPEIINEIFYQSYHEVALYLLRNQFYPIAQSTSTLVTNTSFPFFAIEENDIYLLTNQRQEWTRSINYIGSRETNYEEYTPFNSFSIFTPNSPTTATLLFGINPQYLYNYNIDITLFTNITLFDFIIDPILPQPRTKPNGIELFRFVMLPISDLTTTTPPIPIPTNTNPQPMSYFYYNTNPCFDSTYNTTSQPLYSICPAAIGQPIYTITQCPFDYFGTLFQYNNTHPYDVHLSVSSTQSIIDGFDLDYCGQNRINIDQLTNVEAFWGRINNNIPILHHYYLFYQYIIIYIVILCYSFIF